MREFVREFDLTCHLDISLDSLGPKEQASHERRIRHETITSK